MSSRTARALYRLFLRQCRDLERQGLKELSVRQPIDRGAVQIRHRLPPSDALPPPATLPYLLHLACPCTPPCVLLQRHGWRAVSMAGLHHPTSSISKPSRRWHPGQLRCGFGWGPVLCFDLKALLLLGAAERCHLRSGACFEELTQAPLTGGPASQHTSPPLPAHATPVQGATSGTLTPAELRAAVRRAFRHPPVGSSQEAQLDAAFASLRLLGDQVTLQECSSSATTEGVHVEASEGGVEWCVAGGDWLQSASASG